MSLLKSSLLTPRDLSILTELKQNGLSLVEVKISRLSNALGRSLSSAPLPRGTRALCVTRPGGPPMMNLEGLTLREGDSIYLVTDDERAVRNMFTLSSL